MSNKITDKAEESNPQLETFLQSVERGLNNLSDNYNKINSYRDKFDSNRSEKNIKSDEKGENPSNYKERMDSLSTKFHNLNSAIETELNLMREFV